MKTGDYVIYRSPSQYLTGAPGHTDVYRVHGFAGTGEALLFNLRAGKLIYADPQYARVINPAALMADIDESLGSRGYLPATPGAAAVLSPSAAAPRALTA